LAQSIYQVLKTRTFAVDFLKSDLRRLQCLIGIYCLSTLHDWDWAGLGETGLVFYYHFTVQIQKRAQHSPEDRL